MYNIQNNKNDLLFIPLGGAGEIGMNLNVYHLDGKLLIVDCGAGFADEHYPGIDMIVPNVEFLRENRDKILGIVLTHSHEDHLGGISYVWEQLKCPVYATSFTASFLKAKVEKYTIAKSLKIREIDLKKTLELGPFKIEFTPLTHSTLEMHGLMIRTRYGNIFHTGDWKFDHDPIYGSPADEDQLRAYGKEGIMALIGDSTNIFNKGYSGSEGDLANSLAEIIGNCKNLVAVATFASNVARIKSIAMAAQKAGRRVAVLGRSLLRIIEAAQSNGYLEDIEFLPDSQLSKVNRDQLLVICTGCQGEPLAATAKLANNSHPALKLRPGDNVIFSSKIIPGNDKSIFRIFNQFVENGIEVLTERDHFVHVSGHPSRDELAKMYELVKPDLVIPVHGEIVHMHEHAKFARQNGVKAALEVRNGDIILLGDEKASKAQIIGKAPAGFYCIDGTSLVHQDSGILKTRRRMQKDGIVFVTTIFDRKTMTLRAAPVIKCPGLLDPIEDDELFKYIAENIENALEGNKANGKSGSESIETTIRSTVKAILKQELGKTPFILVHIETI